VLLSMSSTSPRAPKMTPCRRSAAVVHLAPRLLLRSPLFDLAKFRLGGWR
jgi:hypothetical protein